MDLQTPPKPGPTPGQILAKYRKGAPVNVVALAGEFGLRVWEMHSLPPNISGKIFRDPINGGSSGFSIAVNSRELSERKRFTIAHEIAHFILHRDKLSAADLIDDSMYRSGLSTRQEADANRLAADILMPRSLVSTLVASGIRDVDSLASRLQVSIPAMKIRLGIPAV